MANKDLNSWVRLDSAWLHNPKVRRAGLFGRALYIAAMLYAFRQNTDGAVSADVLDLLAAEAGLTMEQAQEAATRLMEVNLWDLEPDGWHIHDYENCQETSDEREGRREQDRERQRRRRAAGVAKSKAVTRESRVSHSGVHDPDVDVDTERDTEERCDIVEQHDDASPPPSVQVPPVGGRSKPNDEGFAQFWDAYPKRDGRKVGKPQAQAQWQKLKPGDRALALVAVAHYAAERGGPGQLSAEDAQRWLKSRKWAEFAEPPDTQALAAANGRRQRVPTAELLAAYDRR